ncbi:hypothetical protein EV2_032996 [Malus domestica]
MVICTASGLFFEVIGVPAPATSASLSRVNQEVQWSFPPSFFFKVNVDVSWSHSSSTGFVGVVILVERGNFVAARRVPISAPSAATAEALALV